MGPLIKSKKYQKHFAALVLAIFIFQLIPTQTLAQAPAPAPAAGAPAAPAPAAGAPAAPAPAAGAPLQKLAETEEHSMCEMGSLMSARSDFDFTCAILTAIDYIAGGLMSYPLAIIENVTSKIINKNANKVFSADEHIRMGWTTLRDIANIFFVFILLWIALATIFDIQQYSARTLLPRFVMAALLINFSLPIGNEIIKISNTLASAFLGDDITQAVKVLTSPLLRAEEQVKAAGDYGLTSNDYQTVGGIHKKIMNHKNTKKIGSYQLVDGSEKEIIVKGSECLSRAMQNRVTEGYMKWSRPLVVGAEGGNSFWRGIWGQTGGFFDNNLAREIRRENELCEDLNSEVTVQAMNLKAGYHGGDDLYKTYASKILIRTIFQVILMFVLGAITFLLVIRIVALSFILILSPMAFLGMVLPVTQRWYHEWWEALFKWSFFFPAFVIFFHIGVTMVAKIVGNTNLSVKNYGGMGDMLMGTLLGGGMLIGGLIAAQKIGIGAAGTAMNFGKKWANTAKDWTKKKAIDRSKMARDVAASGALAIGGGRMPILGKRFETWAGDREQRKVKGEKDTQKRRGRLSAKDRANVASFASGKDAAKILDETDAKERMETFNAMGQNTKNRLTDKLRTVHREDLMRRTGDGEADLYAINPEIVRAKDNSPEDKAKYEAELDNVMGLNYAGAKNIKDMSPEFMQSATGRKWLEDESRTEAEFNALGRASTEHLLALNNIINTKLNADGSEKRTGPDINKFKSQSVQTWLKSAAAQPILGIGRHERWDEYGATKIAQRPQKYKTVENKEQIIKETRERVEQKTYNERFEIEKEQLRKKPEYKMFIKPVAAYSLKLKEETERLEQANKTSANPLPPQTIKFEAERAAQQYMEQMQKIEEEIALQAASIAKQIAQRVAETAAQRTRRELEKTTQSQDSDVSMEKLMKEIKKLQDKGDKEENK